MMTIHFAFSSRSRGMAFSGVAMILWNTRVAFSTRPMSSSRSDAKAGRTKARLAIDTINTFLYITSLLDFSCFLALVKALVALSISDYRVRVGADCPSSRCYAPLARPPLEHLHDQRHGCSVAHIPYM